MAITNFVSTQFVWQLFNLRAELLPWFFLLQTGLLEGELPLLDLLGIVFGHLYYHCAKVEAIKTPGFVKKWYNGNSLSSELVKQKYSKITAEFQV